jgi:hypothetical protein
VLLVARATLAVHSGWQASQQIAFAVPLPVTCHIDIAMARKLASNQNSSNFD